MKKLIWLSLTVLPVLLHAQSTEEKISAIEQELKALADRELVLQVKLEELKVEKIQEDLRLIGLPSEDVIMHSAMALDYSERHEQARWVAHIILPDITTGAVARTNDFRPDPKVETGSAVEEDYFLKYLQPDSTYEYDGFGYDRGHLAPSADFRWSARALSESYYYSNMSPQLPEFNREAWAALEATLRDYLYRHPETQLYVVTGGVLTDDLPVVERSTNKVSIPKFFYKVVLDLKNQRGAGFLMPHQKIDYPLESFAFSIDEIEKNTGLDFFHLLPDELEASIEASLEKALWIPELGDGNVEPIHPTRLPPGHINTVQARRYMGSGERVQVCGRVVSTRYSRSGNLWLNIDRKFPDQIFSVFVRKKDLINFSYLPDKELLNQEVCFFGKINDFNGTPTMNLEKEEEIKQEVPMK